LLVAALTSGISLLEVVTAYFVDERRWSRHRAAMFFGFVIFLIGIPCSLSIHGWGRVEWLHVPLVKVFQVSQVSFFDLRIK